MVTRPTHDATKITRTHTKTKPKIKNNKRVRFVKDSVPKLIII